MMANTFLLCLLLMLLLKVDADLKGNVMTCDNEGMKVELKDRAILCYNCVCKNRLIECQPKHCPKTDDCVHPKTKSTDTCCPSQCKGCWMNGTMHESGTVWRPEPCTHIVCVNGVLTESKIECHTPCDKPLPRRHNECCARCPSCELRGYKMGVGTELRPIEAPCVTCVCDKKGTMACTRKACPVLNCPSRQQIDSGPMDCCPRCRPIPPMSRSGGSIRFMNPPRGHCLLGNWLLKSTQDYAVNSCSSCRCVEEATEPTIKCKAQTCPSLIGCHIKDQRLVHPTDCCKTCVAPKATAAFAEKKKCIFGDRHYESGESFKRGKCVSCQCKEGEVKCAKAECAIRLQTEVPHETSELMLQTAYCKRNFYLTQLPDQCCPDCIEREGRCYVFGGQFKTFDDRHFSFHGSCKYQLATDCSGNRTFSIRMSTVPVPDSNRDLARIVTVKLAEHKVTLGQKLRVKVDGKRVDKLPFQVDDLLELKKDGDYIVLNTNIGLKVAWNGKSLLEISVPVSMHSKVCGLCGNYNGKPGDDFELQHGGRTSKAEEFVESWRAGGLKSCTRNVQSHQPSQPSSSSSTALQRHEGCPPSSKKHHRDYKKCMPIRSDIFKKCHIVVPAMRYYKACLNEMCMCRDRLGGHSRCHCQVIEAYIRECSVMAGSSISPHLQASWRYMLGCYQEAPLATLRQRRQQQAARRRQALRHPHK